MHLKSKHDLCSSLPNTKNTRTILYSESEDEPEEKTQKLSDGDKENCSLTQKKLNRLNDKLIRFLISTDQPMNLVQSDEFRDFCRELNSNYKVPCRNTVNFNFLPEKVKYF